MRKLIFIMLSICITAKAQTVRTDDGTLFGIMENISDKLINNEHKKNQLKRAERHLLKALAILQPKTGSAILTISEADPYDFGLVEIGETRTHMFTVSNTGAVSATVISGNGLTDPFEFSGGSYPGAGGTCGTTLAPGGSCDIEVSYSPTIPGVFSDTILLDYNNGAHAQTSNRGVVGSSFN